MSGPANQEERLGVFRKMVEADPENELAHFSLGKLYFEAEDLKNAERSLRKTLDLNPGHSVAQKFLGQVLSKIGRMDEAVSVLTKGIRLAHEKGEYQPRNQMQEVLRSLGVEPPAPEKEAKAGRSAGGGFACRRCGNPNPPLEEAPFENDLGRMIQERICQSCWREWIAMSIKVINEYRLNLLSPQGNQVYETHLREFLGIEP